MTGGRKRVPVLASLKIPLGERVDGSVLHLLHEEERKERIVSTSSTPEERVYVREVISSKSELSATDIVSSTETIKHLFKMPYNAGESTSGVAIHRFGNTLVMESTHDRFRRRREQGMVSEARRISQRYKKPREALKALPIHLPEHDNQCSNALMNPQDDHEENTIDTDDETTSEDSTGYELVADPETGEIFLMAQDPPQPEEKAQTVYQQVLHDRFLHDNMSRTTLPPSFPVPYERLVHWQFDSMEMLLGSNSMLFQHTPSGDSLSVTLRDVESHWTSLACMDIWLDQVMNGIQRAALCAENENGVIENYQLVRTEELPFLGKNTLFEPALVYRNAQSILRFIQAHCIDEDTTYWLTQNANAVYLFKLPSDVVSAMSSTYSVEHTIGMLCLQMASQLDSAESDRASRLYRKGLQLVDRNICSSQILVQATIATAKLIWAPYMRPYTATRWLDGDMDAFVRAEDVLTQLALVLEACESFTSTPKNTKTLFEIAKQLLPKAALSAKPAPTTLHMPPPMLDDEAQQKEDFEQALALLLETTAFVETLPEELRDAIVACYYVLTHIALQECTFGIALHHLHQVLILVDSYQCSQVPLLVAKVHLRLAMQPKDLFPLYHEQYNQAQAVDSLKIAKQSSEPPLWLQMSCSAASWEGDCEQHLNIALTCAMQVGNYSSLPFLIVGRDHIHRCFRDTLRDTYISLARHLVSTGRHTKGARHAEQGILLFTSLGDDLAVVELRIVLAEVALRTNRYHKAITGFSNALSALKRFDTEYVHALDVHVLLLLRFAHTQHALHLQQQLANEALLNSDGELTAAQLAVQDQLLKGLQYAEEAMAHDPLHYRHMCAWRIADSNYLLAGFSSSHLQAYSSTFSKASSEQVWALFNTTRKFYDAAIYSLPQQADTRAHHLLLRLDYVKFILFVGVAIESKFGRQENLPRVHKMALDCLLSMDILYQRRSQEDQIDQLLSGLFQLVEQHAHQCIKYLIKHQDGNIQQLKGAYLQWITARQRDPFVLLNSARLALE
ncbi:hypothetical protein THRCLA_02387 [Thraustotheca clavata]|uniref:EDRF1 N-terminal domain-containing protein n=1 Tax=Thraustotheca clavata TaxID=74557 RepID=A0A1W0A5G7_9STRA|nr:hypothetical protein THRCLA_02387 [Thraustotheca clavata]